MKRRTASAITALTSVGLALGIGAAPAGAWVHSAGHAGAGQIVDGKVVVSFHNTLTRDIRCSYLIGTADAAADYSAAADLVNGAFRKLDSGDGSGYQADFVAGYTKLYQHQALASTLNEEWVRVAPGQTGSATYTPQGTVAPSYAGWSLCQELDTANGASSPSDRTSGVKYDQDASGFTINPAPATPVGNAWGSLGNLLP